MSILEVLQQLFFAFPNPNPNVNVFRFEYTKQLSDLTPDSVILQIIELGYVTAQNTSLGYLELTLTKLGEDFILLNQL